MKWRIDSRFGQIGLSFLAAIGVASTTLDIQATALKRSANQVTFTSEIANPKLVQGETDTVYVNMTVETAPDLSASGFKKPTDMLVVLDVSGSMSAENRLPYAKQAIQELIQRLDVNDRFALVTFDSSAMVRSPFVTVTPEEKSRLSMLVSSLFPGSGTNMGSGLQVATSLLASSTRERSRRVIVLSDGEANEGITTPEALGTLTRALNNSGSVVSSIGMGLGFNERVMTYLADQGGGNFSYLESLASLSSILNKDLLDARKVYAAISSIEIGLPPGAILRDAGGYPISFANGMYSVQTGQLLSGSSKRFFLTVQIPNSIVGTQSFAPPTLRYSVDGSMNAITLDSEPMVVAIVESARRAEAVAAIKKELWQDAWTKNNLAIAQRELNSSLRSGDAIAARSAIADFRKKVSAAEAASGIAVMNDEMGRSLAKAESQVKDAFVGSAEEQKTKLNRTAKELWGEANSNQRSVK